MGSKSFDPNIINMVRKLDFGYWKPIRCWYIQTPLKKSEKAHVILCNLDKNSLFEVPISVFSSVLPFASHREPVFGYLKLLNIPYIQNRHVNPEDLQTGRNTAQLAAPAIGCFLPLSPAQVTYFPTFGGFQKQRCQDKQCYLLSLFTVGSFFISHFRCTLLMPGHLCGRIPRC